MATEAPVSNYHEEFVFRRLVDPLPVFWQKEPINGLWWLVPLAFILTFAAIYVVWMYVRDGRSVGWVWGAFLGAIRISVYAILTILFLMPAYQVLDESITRFKVLVLFDVSGSMTNKDDLPTDTVTLDKILTRQDKILRFLNDDQAAFLKRLQKNPMSLYRFGTAVDPGALAFDEGGTPPDMEDVKAFLKPEAKYVPIPADAPTEEKEAARKKYDLQVMLLNGTNVPDALATVLKRESSNQPQGIIVFSDGRSTQFSQQAVNEVQKSKIPVFTVGVGDYREPVHIIISELQVPPQIQPDTPFPARIEVDGPGMADQEVNLTIDVFKPGKKEDEDKKEDENRKPDMQLTQKIRFKPGATPHAQAEFPFEPAKLPADFRKTDSAKPELLDGKWKFIARIPKDKREIFEGKEHVSKPAYVRVVKKPLRVLLFAGGPNRDYQFARALLVRETDQKRADLSIFIQNARPEIVQDVPEDRMLKEFPNHIMDVNDPNEKPDEKYLNFLQYDVIVAFDPDWTKLTTEQLHMLEKWVDKYRGGLIVVGGPVNTVQLARPQNLKKLEPLLNVLPVVLEDNRIQNIDRSTAEPWRLHFTGATSEMEFLKLDEENPDKEVLSGWEEFFTGKAKHDGGRDVALRRGFYDFYPVREVKTNTTVVATFTDPRARMKDGKEQPYIAIMPYGSGQHNVVWIGSGEIWRLRQVPTRGETFHERFWIKLIRYAGAGSQTGQKERGYITPLDPKPANKQFKVTARLDGKDMNPLPQTEKPKAVFKALAGEFKGLTIDMKPVPIPSGDKWEGFFVGQAQLPVGEYSIEIAIPGTADKIKQGVSIEESNPEKENPRPDFVELRRLASNSKDVLERVPEEVRTKLEGELERTNRTFTKEGDRDLRLYFDLKGAEVIPDCMTRKPLPQISRGPIKDLWDWGFEAFGMPKISFALLLIVGLFSIEWLTRKLLKLA